MKSALTTILLLPQVILAAVPLRWTVETSRVQPVSFDVVRGETLALEAAFNSYGTPLQPPSTATLFYQTNGMDSAWWVASAAVNSNRVSATFTPQMDPGASVVRGFLGATGDIYRAAFTLRFRSGPGATPNAIDAPVPVLDLANTVVVNPPWPTTNDFETATNSMQTALKSYIDSEIEGAGVVTPTTVTNIVTTTVTKDYVEGLGISAGLSAETVTNIASSASVTNAGAVAAAKDATSEDETWLLRMHTDEDRGDYGLRVFSWDKDNIYLGYSDNDTNPYMLATRDYVGGMIDMIDADDVGARPDTWTPTAAEVGAATPSDVTNVVEDATNGLASASSVSSLSSDVSSLSTSVTAISGHLNAEDAHFVSTNYDSSVRLPEAFVEVKIDGAWLTIWKEMRRWTAFVGSAFSWDTWGGFYDWSTNVTANISSLWNTKADRCWGIYDSETGGYSPEGYTQISSSNILIAANMAYQRTVTSGGNVWVLQCNTGTAHIGGDTNGFFRILDGDGNVQFEIIKGSKRELGADADGITVDNSTTPPTCTIPYSVVAAEHPKIYVCNDLSTANWKDEDDSDCVANVTWTGSSGAWVASVQAKTAPAPKLFVKATYESGGETYIRNVAPVGMSSIYLNGTKYYLGTATIDGHTVLTLSTTAQ